MAAVSAAKQKTKLLDPKIPELSTRCRDNISAGTALAYFRPHSDLSG